MTEFPYLSQESLLELLKGTKMMETLSSVSNVFKCPNFKITELSAIGESEEGPYPKIEAKDIWYVYCGGYEYEIRAYPEAIITYPDKMFLVTFDIPVGPSTSPENFWSSVLAYKQISDFKQTVVTLGKYSMGVNEDGSFGDGTEISWVIGNAPTIYGGDLPPQINKGNSMTFVVDPSYLQPEMYEEYEDAKKIYERNESPLMI